MGVGGWVGGVEKWRLKLTSAKVEVEVEAELGKKKFLFYMQKGMGIRVANIYFCIFSIFNPPYYPSNNKHTKTILSNLLLTHEYHPTLPLTNA